MHKCKYKAIVFDLDGVIIDSGKVMQAAFFAAFDQIIGGSRPSFVEYEKHLGKSFKEIMKAMELPLDMQPAFIKESNKRTNMIKTFDGVHELLQEIKKKNITICIATGKETGRAKSIIKKINLSSYFKIIIGTESGLKPKPAPDMLYHIMEALSLNNREILFCGDAITDQECAKNAGVDFAAAIWCKNWHSQRIVAKAKVVLETPMELVSYIEKNENYIAHKWPEPWQARKEKTGNIR